VRSLQNATDQRLRARTGDPDSTSCICPTEPERGCCDLDLVKLRDPGRTGHCLCELVYSGGAPDPITAAAGARFTDEQLATVPQLDVRRRSSPTVSQKKTNKKESLTPGTSLGDTYAPAYSARYRWDVTSRFDPTDGL